MQKFRLYLAAGMVLFVQLHCHINKSIERPLPIQAPNSTLRVMLQDSLFVNKGAVHDGHAGFLQSNSRIKGADATDQHGNKFSIGLIDFDGNGRFDDINQDLYFVSIFGNRKIKINNGYGLAVQKLGGPMTFQIDSTIYSIKNTGPAGDFIDIEEQSPSKTLSDLSIRLQTCVRDTLFENYSGLKSSFKDIIKDKKYAFIYFWVSRPFEDGLNMIQYIHEAHANEIAIIGMHPEFADLDINAYKSDFFRVLAKPWPQLICPRPYYMELHQDLSWYTGILVDQDLRILKIYTTPTEVFNWLEQR